MTGIGFAGPISGQTLGRPMPSASAMTVAPRRRVFEKRLLIVTIESNR
jgi:hypothetical protein